MPRDMFGDVIQPSIKIGNRKWYNVPVSLMSHAMIVLAFVAVPFLAPGLLPAPDSMSAFIMDGQPPIPPDPPRPKPTEAAHDPAPNPDAAPTSMPTEIGVEQPRDPDIPINSHDGFVDGGGGDALVPPPALVQPAPPVDPIRIGGIIRPPTKLSGQQPVYPPIAQSARVQGIVIIEATIGTDGQVINAKLLRSIPLLDQVALEAVRTWRYSPTLLNGIPVAVIMTVTVQFSLQ